MRLAIVGSRNFGNEKLVRMAVRYACQIFAEDVEIVSGGAKGPDAWSVDEFKKLTGRPGKVFPVKSSNMGHTVDKSEWMKDFRDRAFARNKEIVDNADAVLAFWTIDSTGTANTVTYAKLKDVPTKVFGSDSAEEKVLKAIKIFYAIQGAKTKNHGKEI